MRHLPTDILRRLDRRWVIIASLIVALLFALVPFCLSLHRYHQHLAWSRSIEGRIARLAAKRPKEVRPNQWAYCLHWTWNLHANHGAIAWKPGEDRSRFLQEFDQKLSGKVDLGTIDWIWDEYVKHSPGDSFYSENYRPTDPNHIRDWFDSQPESYHLEEWIERAKKYHQE